MDKTLNTHFPNLKSLCNTSTGRCREDFRWWPNEIKIETRTRWGCTYKIWFCAYVGNMERLTDWNLESMAQAFVLRDGKPIIKSLSNWGELFALFLPNKSTPSYTRQLYRYQCVLRWSKLYGARHLSSPAHVNAKKCLRKLYYQNACEALSAKSPKFVEGFIASHRMVTQTVGEQQLSYLSYQKWCPTRPYMRSLGLCPYSIICVAKMTHTGDMTTSTSSRGFETHYYDWNAWHSMVWYWRHN